MISRILVREVSRVFSSRRSDASRRAFQSRRDGRMHSGTECLVHIEMCGFSVGYAFDFRYAMEFVVAHMARLARLTCLFGFRDSYGLLDHLSSDSFDYGNDGLFDPPRSFLHWRAFGLGLGNRSLCSLDYLACLTAFSGVCSSQFGSALYFSLLGAPQHALMPDHQLIVGSYQQIAA